MASSRSLAITFIASLSDTPIARRPRAGLILHVHQLLLVILDPRHCEVCIHRFRDATEALEFGAQARARPGGSRSEFVGR